MARTATKEKEPEKVEKTPRERFLALAPKRTTQALHALRVLGNCAGTGYEFSEDEAAKIVTALRQRMAEVEAKFLAPQSKAKEDKDAFAL